MRDGLSNGCLGETKCSGQEESGFSQARHPVDSVSSPKEKPVRQHIDEIGCGPNEVDDIFVFHRGGGAVEEVLSGDEAGNESDGEWLGDEPDPFPKTTSRASRVASTA